MSRQIPGLLAFNRGVVSPLGLARTDQKRVALSAETQTNFIARVLGSMSFRPGTAYIGATDSNNAARFLKFIFATSDTALIEITNTVTRIWINDVVLTRPSVSTTISNGVFSTNITGWTDGSDAGGVAAWDTGDYLKLTSNGTARAIAYQFVSVAGGDVNKEHGIRVRVDRGPITFRIGLTLGGEELLAETNLDEGYHSISITPSAGFYIQFAATTIYKKRVKSCTMETAGIQQINSPWATADLGNIRYDQSGDVVFVACDGIQQYKVERRGVHPGGRSWSVVKYYSDDGPFRVTNIGPITISSGATTGDVTLTASQPLFRSGHVGSIFSITTAGQTKTATIAAQNTFTASIKVTGVGADRGFGIFITGTIATSTITTQRSTDNATWTDVPNMSFTALTSSGFNDGMDNQLIYYRAGIKTGDYGAPDSVTVTLTFSGGSQTGITRITAVASSTSASAQVLTTLGGLAATATWAESNWSTYRGFPTSVRIHEGRLWWFGHDGIWGSVSDSFYSFDDTTLGDSGPLNRTIGSGPVDVINFALGLQRLIIGTEGREISARSSALDTPLTPTDFNMKDASTQGSAKVEAWKIDQRGIYVQRGGIKVYELAFDIQSYDYSSTDITAICPELGSPGIVRMDVQRQPDTRIHCVRSDGVVMIGTYDKQEDVLAWQLFTTNGTVEDVVVLPGANGSTEDQVYYVVNRTLPNLTTGRYLEKWAKETECRGGTLSKNLDAHITFTNAPASVTVTGLTHLISSSVRVWADGAPALAADGSVKQFTVDGSGNITLDAVASTGIVGLNYTGLWKSAKLGMQTSAVQTMLAQQKRLSHIGFILAYFFPKALQFGPDFAHLDDMPSIEQGTTYSTTQTSYDEQEFPFPGTWVTDMRLCLQAQCPLPVTVLAAVVDLEVHD